MSNDDDASRGMPPPPPPGPNGPAPQTPRDWGGDVAPTEPQPAGVGTRVVAYIIDSIIIGIVNFLISLLIVAPFIATDASGMPSTPFPSGAAGVASIVAGLIGAAITLAYFGYLEGKNAGRTLGKMMLSIRAVRADAGPLDLNLAVKRRLPFVVASLAGLVPVIGWIASIGIPIAILVTAIKNKPWNRGWHDQFAGTMVVRS